MVARALPEQTSHAALPDHFTFLARSTPKRRPCHSAPSSARIAYKPNSEDSQEQWSRMHTLHCQYKSMILTVVSCCRGYGTHRIDVLLIFHCHKPKAPRLPIDRVAHNACLPDWAKLVKLGLHFLPTSLGISVTSAARNITRESNGAVLLGQRGTRKCPVQL